MSKHIITITVVVDSDLPTDDMRRNAEYGYVVLRDGFTTLTPQAVVVTTVTDVAEPANTETSA